MAEPKMVFSARFHVREEFIGAVQDAFNAVVSETRREPGNVAIRAVWSTSDPRLFLIQSDWVDEAAFDLHATLPHTMEFISKMEKMVDEPVEFTRGVVLA